MRNFIAALLGANICFVMDEVFMSGAAHSIHAPRLGHGFLPTTLRCSVAHGPNTYQMR